MIKSGILLFLCLFSLQTSQAQQKFTYDNKVYNTEIKTVQLYNTQKEQSIPVIALGTSEKLSFSFDDLRGGSKNYWYTVEHCTYDWKSSNLSALDYLDGMNEDRIIDYAYSSKTLQKFTHYSLTFPNDQLKPKLSGNYLLKVYENGEMDRPVISQRFYITDQQVNIQTEVVPSNEVSLRFSNQKVNVTVLHKNPIQNPYQDIKMVLMQNGNPLTAKLNTKPTYVKPGSLIYNDLASNDFKGSNEFRKFDFRSLRYKGEHVQDIFTDSTNNAVLFTDQNGTALKYTQQIDEDGAFFIRNQDNIDNDTDSDYGRIQFALNAVAPGSNGDIYVVGRFNNYTLTEENKLSYVASKKKYYASIYLKQGLYDYQYVWKDNTTGNIDHTVLEGSFFETENNYQAFVYYRRPGSRWDELIGYSLFNNIQK
ncbi:hypothetical protein HDF26_005352 [Pedobacter cryoconitis]|uniref:Type 9 secretion system plug protein N-terminal domain-containing protein n=1 Tax=Pedobacter cryoconitis TaxID=188932 RepID=A0A7W8ZS21_9SPHI|nr:DUF5103 domain-containing protein [Pedobacter cryoconitis]MBB5639161.1 hypothetical protein [Pedobacter cryoconitis]MBB6274866.1 hypothetical protein [Pedobacter cryoconitis]